MRRRDLLFAAPAVLAANPARASRPAIEWGAIHIYQAEILDEVLPDEQALSAYIRALKVATELEAREGEVIQASGVLFVALGPGGRSRVWLLGDDARLTSQMRARWERALSAVHADVVVRHYFLFGLSFGVGGAVPIESDAPPPLPQEWEAEIPPEGARLDDAFIGRVWPARR